jgi:Protein of unknown function (DUF4038)/Putative collagen-binding domain of a collagenase
MGMVQRGYNGRVSGGPPASYPHLDRDGANRVSGAVPLTTPGDFRTFHDAYWRNVADLVRTAGDRGMAVLLAYNYLGYGGYGGAESQGWWTEINRPENADPVMYEFGRRLVRTLEATNVVWYPYGDFNPPEGEGSRRVLRSIEGIRAADPHALFAAELAPPDDLPAANAAANAVLDVNAFYGNGPDNNGAVYETARAAWDDRSRGSMPRPAWVCEPPYEGTTIGGPGTREAVRTTQWYSALGGGTAGQTFGTLDIYCFDPQRWRRSLASPGSRDMAVQFAFYDSLAWHRLVPSGVDRYGVEIVTAGQGTGLDHIAAAGTDDGTRLVAYVPPGSGQRTFTVDLGLLRPRRTVRWVDPTTGESRAVDGNPATVTTPGANASGVTDWVLDVTGA